MTQAELRDELLEAMATRLDSFDMVELGDLVQGDLWLNGELDRAKKEVYALLMEAMKKLSRLAARLDYLEKEKN